MTGELRARTRIGVLVPFTNTNLEPDMVRLCPPGCTLSFDGLRPRTVGVQAPAPAPARTGSAELWPAQNASNAAIAANRIRKFVATIQRWALFRRSSAAETASGP